MNDFFSGIHEIYRISLRDLVHDKKLINDQGFIDFVRVVSYTNEELEQLLMYTISWLEIVGTKKSMLKSVFLKKKAELDFEEASKYLTFKENADRKLTVKDIESLVESDLELLNKRKKILEYEAYLEYLEQLQDTIELLHYSVKSILNERALAWKMNGSA